MWGHATLNHVRKAQILLNQAGRFVTGADRTASNSSLMRQCSWLNISSLTEYHSLLQMFKSVRWGTPAVLTYIIEIHKNYLISTGAPRLLLTANSYRHKTVHYWNNLPVDIRIERKIAKFKTSVKRWLLDRQTLDPGPP